MTERNVEGPLVGVPLTYAEMRALLTWAQAEPVWRAELHGSLWRWDTRRQTLRRAVAALRPTAPHLARSLAASLAMPAAAADLSPAERALVTRLRDHPGTYHITVQHEEPVVTPWPPPRALVPQAMMDLAQVWAAAEEEHPAMDDLTTRLRAVTTDLARVARTLEEHARALEAVTGQWATVQTQWDTVQAQAARYTLLQQLMTETLAADAPRVEPVVEADLPEASRRVWASLWQATEAGQAPVRSATLRRQLGMPRRTLADALARLERSGYVARQPGSPPYLWRALTPPPAALDGPPAAPAAPATAAPPVAPAG
jgi:hypothetical protein